MTTKGQKDAYLTNANRFKRDKVLRGPTNFLNFDIFSNFGL